MGSVLDEILVQLRSMQASIRSLQHDVDEIKRALYISPRGDMAAPADLGTVESICDQALSPEASFFRGIIQIYVDEHARKNEAGNKWASGRMVARKCAAFLADFLQERLRQDFPAIIVRAESAPGRDPVYVVVRKPGDKRPKAVIRYWTDLGYRRGEQWVKELRPLVLGECAALGAQPADVLLLVCTLNNSLDNRSVRSILDEDAMNVGELILPGNRRLLHRYLNGYLDTVDNDVLPNAKEQCYFLAGAVHPNDRNQWTADAPYLSPEYHDWVKPSISELIEHLKPMCK